jgi:hypothetical protein
LGFGYDEAARAAAVALGSDPQYENKHITLLTDIRTVFDHYDKDRLCTEGELIPALAGLARGRMDRPGRHGGPHMLTQEIEDALARRDDARERNQTSRPQFEAAWPPIANQAPHRHRQAKSGTCRGREPPHARRTFEVLPPGAA